MNHLSRDELVLLHYGEPLPPALREHAEQCPDCRSEREVLGRVLGAVDDVAPSLPADWEETLWSRLRWRLQHRRNRSPWYAAAGVAASLALAFLIGRELPRRSEPLVVEAARPAANRAVPASTGSTDEGRERILLVVLGDHFTKSERLLTEVKNASTATLPSDPADIEELLNKNRLYHDAAVTSGQASLALVLEEIEPLLVELARAPEQPTERDLAMLQKRIEKRDLVFKLRIASEQTRKQQSL